MKNTHKELSVIQKTYDLILWYIPIINRLPRDHKFALGDRITTGLYDLLEHLITARYTPKNQKGALLNPLNNQVEKLRYQTRLLLDFQLINHKRYEFAAKQLHMIGAELGAWLRNNQNSR